jgi:hypothetical protein
MDRHRLALRLIAAAILLGIAGDAMLRWVPWGLNALLWTILFCLAATVCARTAPSSVEPATPEDAGEPARRRVSWFPLLCAVVAAAGMMWRDSNVLVTLDVLLLLLFLPMLALDARGVQLYAAGLARIATALVVTAAQTVAGFPQLIGSDLSWSRMPRGSFRGTGVALRGTVIAAPALLIFGSLLTAADPAFARLLRELIAFDVEEAFVHIAVAIVIAVLCAGFLRSLAVSGPAPTLDGSREIFLPTAEANFALELVNLLFALFVVVQFRYFFGSAPDEIAEYARRGFFELVWVVGLVVPMLLFLEWLVAKERGFALFRGLAAMQVGLVFLIAASAFHRMQLYRDAYGLTRLRIYTTAFMIWLAILLLWFVATVLTRRRHRFAIGALASGMMIVVALHAINPDALIVNTNVERARGGRRHFDSNYAVTLSDDAAPAIVANANAFSPLELLRYRARPRPSGWRTWNISRAEATRVLRTLPLPQESKATPPIGRP